MHIGIVLLGSNANYLTNKSKDDFFKEGESVRNMKWTKREAPIKLHNSISFYNFTIL